MKANEAKARNIATNLSSNLEDPTLRRDFIRCWVHANPTVEQSKASKLYDALCEKFPGMTRGGHRGMVGRLKPWENLVHECPCCGEQAQGLQGIKDAFGLRLVTYKTKKGPKSKLYFQSWCRECRREDRKGGSGARINPEVEKFFTNESDARQ